MERLISSKAKVLGFGLLSALIVVLVATAQVALAGPSHQADGPPPPPPLPPGAVDGNDMDIPPTPLPPDVMQTTQTETAPYDWFNSTTVEAGAGVQVFVPARSMTVGGNPASGHLIVKPLATDQGAAVNPDAVPDRPTLLFSGQSAQITVYGHTGTTEPGDITAQAQFSTPLQITLGISDEVWDAAGADIGNFEVRYYSDQGRWVGLSGVVNPFSPRGVTVSVSHLTTFGLFYEEPEVVVGPIDGGDISLGMSSVGLAALFGLTLVAAGFYVRRRAIQGSR